jgi:SAM-dependent methyltransferase
MSVLNYLLEQSLVYRLWQTPFATAKLEPLFANNSIARARRVLDVGCGPGTNTSLFEKTDYLGIDINPKYIDHARQKHQRNFLVADVSTYDQQPEHDFDFILVNSFLHHLDTPATSAILSRLQSWLSPDGHIHVLELVRPEAGMLPKFMARIDRGKFPRPLPEWRNLFSKAFEIEQFEPYPLRYMGVELWGMIYCMGRRKS